MKRLVAIFAACILTTGVGNLRPARAAGSSCATSAARIVESPKLTLPEDAKITSKSIAFEVDIGSDGRVRALQLVQSSGDAKVDLDLRQALQTAAYEPPQTGCIAYSGGLRLTYNLGADSSAPPPAPTARTSSCTPYVSAFLSPTARDRKRTGTAIVGVELDAAGTRAGTPLLRKSTGSAVLDEEALRVAATGHFSFLRAGPCTPQAFTYSLELTFQ